jgi:periplasmic divalent cation tolerance protein
MTDEAREYLLVLTNMPDRQTAIKLARTLVGKRLAACANVMDGCSSVFRWQGEIQSEREVPVLIKTRADRFELLQQEILACHPYELPEIIAVPVEGGFQPYLNWVSAEVDAAAQTRTGGGPE